MSDGRRPESNGQNPFPVGKVEAPFMPFDSRWSLRARFGSRNVQGLDLNQRPSGYEPKC